MNKNIYVILILFASPMALADKYADLGIGLYEVEIPRGAIPPLDLRVGTLEARYGREFAWDWNIEAGLIKGVVDKELSGCVYEIDYGYSFGINRDSSRLVYGANYTKLEGDAECNVNKKTYEASDSGAGFGLGFRFGSKDTGVKLMFETVMDDVRRITLIKKIAL